MGFGKVVVSTATEEDRSWGLKADVTMCKGGGGCDYTEVQATVDAALEWGSGGLRFVICVKAGVWDGRAGMKE